MTKIAFNSFSYGLWEVDPSLSEGGPSNEPELFETMPGDFFSVFTDNERELAAVANIKKATEILKIVNDPKLLGLKSDYILSVYRFRALPSQTISPDDGEIECGALTDVLDYYLVKPENLPVPIIINASDYKYIYFGFVVTESDPATRVPEKLLSYSLKWPKTDAGFTRDDFKLARKLIRLIKSSKSVEQLNKKLKRKGVCDKHLKSVSTMESVESTGRQFQLRWGCRRSRS